VSAEVKQSSHLTIADINDVTSWGWDGRRLVEEVLELAYETTEDLTSDHVGEAEQWVSSFVDHPDTWRLIINAPESIVAYWHFLPLCGSMFELAKEGSLMDSQITDDSLLRMEQPGWYDIYVVSVCVRSGFRGISVLMLIGKSFLDVIKKFALKGIFIREVCSNAFTPIALGFNKGLGLNYVCDHIDHGKIFLSELSSILQHSRFKDDPEFNISELCKLYGVDAKR
jgi:hypothetical protein